MSALPDLYGEMPTPVPVSPLVAPVKTPAVLLPFPRHGPDGRILIDEASGDRLGAARGLLFGLSAGVVLWATLFGAAYYLLS